MIQSRIFLLFGLIQIMNLYSAGSTKLTPSFSGTKRPIGGQVQNSTQWDLGFSENWNENTFEELKWVYE